MPATSYLVAAQVALLAASVAYLRPGKPEAPAVPSVSETDPAEMVSRKDGASLEAKAVFQELNAGRRFALAEQSDWDVPEVAERAMGSAGRAGLRSATRATTEADQAGGKVRPVSAAALSEVKSDQPPKFEPVPDGAGYSITADSATNFDLKTRTVVFVGHVSLVSQDFTLSADRLVVHMESAGGQMSRLVANGNVEVHMTQGTAAEQYHGTGEEAVYEPVKQTLLFLGWPRIRGQGREHRAAAAGTRMTLHLNPARLVTEGRAQTRILPGEGGSLSGFGGQAAAP